MRSPRAKASPSSSASRSATRSTSILAACKEADLLLIGGTAGRLAALIQRPIVERLLGRCDAPILVVNGPQCLSYARALVVIRDAPGAVSALRATGCLWPAAEKVIFYAVDPRLRRARQMIEASSSRGIDSPRRRAQIVGFLKGLVRRAGLRVHDVSCRFRYGDGCHAALSLQSEVQADVMVLTRRSSSAPSTDFVLDKTASRLLALAPCDVLITAVERLEAGAAGLAALEAGGMSGEDFVSRRQAVRSAAPERGRRLRSRCASIPGRRRCPRQ